MSLEKKLIYKASYFKTTKQSKTKTKPQKILIFIINTQIIEVDQNCTNSMI